MSFLPPTTSVRPLRGSRRPAGKPEQALLTSHPGINKSLFFIAQRFDRPIRVCDLVTVSGLSHRGFFKAFGKHVGVKPRALLEQMRIDHAKKLLQARHLELKDVARRCGYQSENSFWVAFRRVTGLAPRDFQRDYRN